MDKTVIAILATAISSIQFIPQVVKAFKKNDLSSISLSSFVMILLAALFWLLHGINHHDNAIIIANIITITCSLLILLRKFQTKKPASPKRKKK